MDLVWNSRFIVWVSCPVLIRSCPFRSPVLLPGELAGDLQTMRVEASQAFARHSHYRLAYNDYSQLGLVDQANALKKVSPHTEQTGSPEKPAEVIRATGTEDDQQIDQQISSKWEAFPGTNRHGGTITRDSIGECNLKQSTGLGAECHNKTRTGAIVKMAGPIRIMATPTGFEPVLPA